MGFLHRLFQDAQVTKDASVSLEDNDDTFKQDIIRTGFVTDNDEPMMHSF